ncbi:unnamed protein product [Coregonus sp. 'balchen']|nr:unnamed protein product [Coregonus sp. 'balchen']
MPLFCEKQDLKELVKRRRPRPHSAAWLTPNPNTNPNPDPNLGSQGTDGGVLYPEGSEDAASGQGSSDEDSSDLEDEEEDEEEEEEEEERKMEVSSMDEAMRKVSDPLDDSHHEAFLKQHFETLAEPSNMEGAQGKGHEDRERTMSPGRGPCPQGEDHVPRERTMSPGRRQKGRKLEVCAPERGPVLRSHPQKKRPLGAHLWRMSSPLARAPAFLDRAAGLQMSQSAQNLATEDLEEAVCREHPLDSFQAYTLTSDPQAGRNQRRRSSIILTATLPLHYSGSPSAPPFSL